MYQYYAFYKPFNVLSQFSPSENKRTLSDFLPSISKDIYPVGRLDFDSEGLLILTNDSQLNHKLLHPLHAHERTYFVQAEGIIDQAAITMLQNGVLISIDGQKIRTRPARVDRLLPEPSVPARNPPIRFRKDKPVCWFSLTLTEGRNRQVRRMTAAVGFPTLRLIRYSINGVNITGMQPGEARVLNSDGLNSLLRSLRLG